jgi:hypothetical protein
LKRLNAHAAELYATGAPVVLAGDYNVVPTDLDIYPTKSWDYNALLQPESRAAYQRLLAEGWTDSVRALHPKEPMYTFWDYKWKRWERDGGLRLDHILLSSALRERLHSAGVDRETRGMEGASDHAPVWVNIQDEPDRRRAPLRQAMGERVASTATASPKKRRSRTPGRGLRRALQPCSLSREPRQSHPADVYFGRPKTILLERERIKRQTIANRRLQHHLHAA